LKIYFLLSGVLLTAATSVLADDQFLVNFKHVKEGRGLERGNVLVSEKPHTWSKGLKRSYLKLRCQQTETGKARKLFSTVDHFAGLSLRHQLTGNNIELVVVRTTVKPVLAEIHALPKNECKDMSPIVTTISQKYSFIAVDGAKESRPFSEKSEFQVTIKLLSEN
jgi:hypothetical protein